MQYPSLGSRRTIIDRRAISDSIHDLAREHRSDPAKLRGLIVRELKSALDAGRLDVARRLEAKPTRGREARRRWSRSGARAAVGWRRAQRWRCTTLIDLGRKVTLSSCPRLRA